MTPANEFPASQIDEPSFIEAMDAITASDDLPVSRRRHWATSLRQIASYLDRPPAVIPARISAIAGRVAGLHPHRLGVNARTFFNHRANCKAALNWYGHQTLGSARTAPMQPAYRALLGKVDDRYQRDVLSPLLRWLSASAIALDDVDDEVFAGYVGFRSETSFRPLDRSAQRQVIRAWNRAVETVPGWPEARLAEPAHVARTSGPPWEAFPASLREDIETYCAGLARPRRSVSGRRLRPCAASTIEKVRRELVAAVRAAVAAGIPLGDLCRLADLVQPDTAETVLDHYWMRNGQTPTGYTIDLAHRFVTVARDHCHLDDTALARLRELYETLAPHRQHGLTAKNRKLLRQILNTDIWADVVTLPSSLMAEARAGRKAAPLRSAVRAQLAIAVRILCVAPVRIKNLAAIRIDQHLTRPGGPGSCYLLGFDEAEVKNRVPLEFPLDESTSEMVDEYIALHRPVLLCGYNCDHLFPGPGGGAKCTKTLSEQIKKLLHRRLGLDITVHQFRHVAGALLLRADPGNYETVRRLLGHTSLATTTSSYIGLETLAANRRFVDLVTTLEDDKAR